MKNVSKLFFEEIQSDRLMAKINLRDLSSKAKQWDNPGKGLLKFLDSLKRNNGDIYKVPKKERELYCLSLFGFGLQEDTTSEWWVHVPQKDPPDGLVMRLLDIKEQGLKVIMREIEIVEHRIDSNLLFDEIVKKVKEKSYNPDTVLVCLILSPALYNLMTLSQKLVKVSSKLNHVFVVFGGVMFDHNIEKIDVLKGNFTVVQLLPKFNSVTFNIDKQFESFKEKYNKGQESRIIDNGEIHYGTANPKFITNTYLDPRIHEDDRPRQ